MITSMLWAHIITPIALFLGSLKLFVLLLDTIGYIRMYYLTSKVNHLERYGGKGTWALVTGSTDGIGLEFCRQLARDGFNICLVSRTESKLKAVIEGELSQFGVQLRYVIADFAQNSKMKYYDRIMSEVQDIDVGLVIVNAGVANVGKVAEIEIEKLEQMLDVNVYQYSMLTHKFASRLEARKAAHSGIILLSSVTAHLPGAISGVTYHASKVFVKYLAQAMAYESSLSTGKRSKIDLLCLQPGFVKTKMIKFAEEKKLDFGVVPTDTCVADSL